MLREKLNAFSYYYVIYPGRGAKFRIRKNINICDKGRIARYLTRYRLDFTWNCAASSGFLILLNGNFAREKAARIYEHFSTDREKRFQSRHELKYLLHCFRFEYIRSVRNCFYGRKKREETEVKRAL